MKKHLTLAVLLFSSGLALADTVYKDGVYTGTGDGNLGRITAQVTVRQGRIAEIKVLDHHDTQTMIQAPIDIMIPDIIERNGTEGVMNVAGATNSSEGIKKAVREALKQAKATDQ